MKYSGAVFPAIDVTNLINERSRKLDEKLRRFRLYQNIRDAIGGVDIIGNDNQGKKMIYGHGGQAPP